MVMVVLVMTSPAKRDLFCLSRLCDSGHVHGVQHDFFRRRFLRKTFLHIVPVHHQCRLTLALQYYVVCVLTQQL